MEEPVPRGKVDLGIDQNSPHRFLPFINEIGCDSTIPHGQFKDPRRVRTADGLACNDRGVILRVDVRKQRSRKWRSVGG